MKINIVSVCKYKIHEREFVDPIFRISKKFGDASISNYKKIKRINEKTIICGTAIKDFEYLENFPYNVLNTDKKIFGICAGAQIISKYFNIPLIDKELIGKYKTSNGYSFFLITKVPDPYIVEKEFEVIDYLEDIPVFCKKNNFYYTLFHPEVLNKNIIEDFLLDYI